VSADAAGRLPPGQHEAQGWPALHFGEVPVVDLGAWRLRVHGAVASPRELTLAEVRALPGVRLRTDFHCVTKFSVFDNDWEGVRPAEVLRTAQVDPAASHVMVEAVDGYTANLPLDVLDAEDTVFAWRRNGEDLTPEHGWPLRLVVPGRYAWKSVKWVSGLELLTSDRRGFWEERGYHNRADPWLEERYSYQEGG
jgi:DMSO/TMAO reductase YedYZ molybdopterin-dependent catalytic subunit